MIINRNDIMRSFSQFKKDNDPFVINFIGKSICDDKFYTERDNSDIMSIEYIESGEGTLFINGQEHHPCTGDVFLLTEGSKHSYYTSAEDPWRKYFVSFGGPLAHKFKELYLPYNTYLFKNCDVKDSFVNIFNIAFDDDQTYESIIAYVTVEVLKIMIHLHSIGVNEQEDLADVIKNKIDYCIEGEFSLDSIAESLSYSKNHIINVFKDKFEKTPYQYYIEAKIEIAKRYLKQTSCSIADISANLAFSDPQYFSSSFKRLTGVSPREYRKNSSQ